MKFYFDLVILRCSTLRITQTFHETWHLGQAWNNPSLERANSEIWSVQHVSEDTAKKAIAWYAVCNMMMGAVHQFGLAQCFYRANESPEAPVSGG